MLNKKYIKKEISVLNFLLLTTSKILIGIGIGAILVNKIWFAQPYWFLSILIGLLILIPTLYKLTKIEYKKEKNLKKKLKKKK